MCVCVFCLYILHFRFSRKFGSVLFAVTQSSQFAEEALAGLASTENFNKVALCKVDSINRQGNFQPFTDKMLLQVKGFKQQQPAV